MNRYFLPLIFSLVGLVLGLHPLVDPDTGWHLAGGLWIFEHGALPTIDPFGEGGRFWLAYSWFPEMILAAVYRWGGGFTGIYLLQASLAAMSTFALLLFIQEFASVRRIEKPSQLLTLLCTVFLCLPLLSTLWQLRPQLVSLCFFMLALWWADRERLTLFRVLALGTVWANTHVYWVFLPFLCGLCEVLEPVLKREWKRIPRGVVLTAGAFVCGFLSPYGVENVKGIFNYALDHSLQFSIIREFQPLSWNDGFVWWFSLVILGSSLCFASCSLRSVRLGLLLFHWVALFLAFRQLKFSPLLALTSVPLLVRCVFPKIFSYWPGERTFVETRGGERKLLVAFPLFFLVTLLCIDPSPPLPPERHELLNVLSRFENRSGETRVLNHFDEGGWIQLAVWLSPHRGLVKTFIDGRTLVMGEDRLRDFQSVWENTEGHCSALERFQPHAALLRREDALAAVFQRRPERCPGGRWRAVFEGQHWLLFKFERAL